MPTIRSAATVAAVCLVLLLSLAAQAETVVVPPVVISALTHQHFFDAPFNQTITRDAITFPCSAGACNGPGFTASIGQGDVISIRFEAPTGKRFEVIHQPGGTQYFHYNAYWSNGLGDSGSNFVNVAASFENLTGTSPVNTFNQHGVFNNGNALKCIGQYTVAGSFTFTAITLQFNVSHPVPDLLRTYGAVFSTSAPSFGSSRVVNGAASDATLMSIENLPSTEIEVPPVLISTLTHQHIFNSHDNQTVTRDMVQFPCAAGACDGPGFTASIGQGDTIIIRFEAPAGKKFLVTRAPGGQQYFQFWAHWQTNLSDTGSNFATSTVTFENLIGTPPSNTYNLDFVGNAGQVVLSEHNYTVSNNFSFTAIEVEFVVNHALADIFRTYNPVDSYSSPSFGSGRVVNGSVTDATVMSIVSPCFGNTNADTVVNVDDLLGVINGWGACSDCDVDVTGDGNVNVDDLLAVINAWGTCP